MHLRNITFINPNNSAFWFTTSSSLPYILHYRYFWLPWQPLIRGKAFQTTHRYWYRYCNTKLLTFPLLSPSAILYRCCNTKLLTLLSPSAISKRDREYIREFKFPVDWIWSSREWFDHISKMIDIDEAMALETEAEESQGDVSIDRIVGYYTCR